MTESAKARAVEYFVERDYNCAQSVLRAVLEEHDQFYEQATTSMAGIGGGVGLEGDVCGAVVGAVAALGVLNSQRLSDVEKHKDATYISSIEFIRRFKKECGSVICNDLTGITMSDITEREQASEEKLFYKTCPKYLEAAVDLVLEIENKARGE
ncbi:MAG: C-GCAxxG-C-C family protein [Candidatus Thorarchaeota archaeon]|jgi:C_GCAxxG_C_C family probable redox protein